MQLKVCEGLLICFFMMNEEESIINYFKYGIYYFFNDIYNFVL